MIMSVGLLAMMSIIATSFAVNMRLEYGAAVNYRDSLKARYAAEAGMALAIAYMRYFAVTKHYGDPSDNWNYISQSQPSLDTFGGNPANNSTSGSFSLAAGTLNRATYSIKVTDTAGQININDGTATTGRLDLMLRALGLSAAEASAIISNRPAEGYVTKEQVKLYISLASYNTIKDYITVNSYIDQNSEDTTAGTPYDRKAPICINTAPAPVLQAVLEPVTNQPKAQALANAMITRRGSNAFDNWSEFDTYIDGVTITPPLNSTDRANIKNNANPNRVKPTTYTTDFCFHPSGIYEIESLGKIGRDGNSDYDLEDTSGVNPQDKVNAQRKILSIVKVYDVLNFTTKEQFRGEDANYNSILDSGEDTNGNGTLDRPTYERVNWLNTCPVISTDDQGLSYASGYTTIPGSLKIGFWDNFDEDNNDNINKIGYSWSNFSQGSASYPMNIGNADTGDSDNELWGEGWPKFTLYDTAKWKFSNEFSIRVSLRVFLGISSIPSAAGDLDTGHVEFHWGGGPKAKLWTQRWGFFTDRRYGYRIDITQPPPYWRPTVAVDPDSTPRQGKDFFDSKIFLELWDPERNERTYNVGNLYGLTELVSDHYNNWLSEQDQDQYHGVTPELKTLKLVVNSGQTPNYRVYLAVSQQGWHQYWRYDNGWFINWGGYDSIRTGYILIPFHDDASNSLMSDRYNYYRYDNTQPNAWQSANWYLVLYANNARPIWDEVRIIPNNGNYTSINFATTANVKWGTVSWTPTIPSTASATSEQIALQLNTGSGFSAVTINGSVAGTSSTVAYKAFFTTNDADYSETPVFEDVTITYLPRTRIIYLRYI